MYDYDQHTLDEIHGIDANNRDCALSRIVEPVVGLKSCVESTNG